MPNKKMGGLLGWVKTSVWAFPVIVAVGLVLLTTFKVSGSSVGTYYPRWYGSQAEDPDLLYGNPRAIRSDEWLMGTQLTISQYGLGFPRINQNMTGGQDLSLTSDIPIRAWPTVFRPQLWSFFVLPLENAFAFKWWVVMAILVVSCYFFVLRVLPGQRLLATLVGTAFGLSPFLLWWYQSGAFLVMAYGFLATILIMRLINREPVRFIKNSTLSDWLQVSALAFLLVCFGLIFYPPFQIPIAIVVAAFTLGYFLQKLINEKVSFKLLLRPLLLVLGGAAIAGAIGLAFILSHKEPLAALNNSVYPGHRRVTSGNLKFLHVFDSFVMPVEQSDFRGGHFINNQSESSNFILLMPFLLLPGFLLMIREWLQKHRVDWLFLAIQATSVLFLIRVFTHLGDSFFKLLLLDRVPNNRLLIGIGFVGIIQMIYIFKKLRDAEIKNWPRWTLAIAYGGGCFVVLMAIGVYIAHHYPLFLNDYWLIAVFAGGFAAIITAILANLRLLAALFFLGFTVLSAFRIMPIQHGLGLLTHSQLIGRMQTISGPHDSWVTVGSDAAVYEGFGLLAGRRSLSGGQVYPDLNFWSQLGTKYKGIYNRQGHAFFVDNPSQQEPIALLQSDAFLVKFQCSEFITKNVQFALSVHPLTQSCVSLADTVKYPKITFYLYKLQ